MNDGPSLRIDRLPDIAERLKTSRKAMGWSLRTASERMPTRVRVSHAALGTYERGTVTPPTDVLAALATLYQRPMNYLLGDGPALRFVKYRNAKSKVGVRDRHMFEGRCHRMLEAYRAIDNHTGDALARDGDLAHFGVEGQSPDEAAYRLRDQLKLKPDEPVPSVIDVLERAGVRVIEVDTDLAIDGLAAEFGDEYAVVLNARTSNDRSRLNAGHEFWHVLSGDCDTDDKEDRERERAAFEFASHLLLTSEMLHEAFKGKSMVRLVQYRERYGISLAAMIYRAEHEGILDSDLTKRLWIEFSKRGWKRREPGTVRADRALRFESLLDRAIVGGSETFESLAAITGLREDEVRQRLQMATGYDERDDDDDEGEEVYRQPLKLTH